MGESRYEDTVARTCRILILIPLGLFGTPNLLHAADCTSVVPTLNPGEVISADIFNEIFGALQPDLATTLVGTWSTQCWNATVTNVDNPHVGTLTISTLTSISFTDGDADTSTTQGCLFNGASTFSSSSNVAFSRFKTVGNHGLLSIFTYSTSTETERWAVTELQQNCMVLVADNAMARLTRAVLTPNAPTKLSASTSGATVTLTWIDNSSDETSFRIVRKGSITGTYAQVGTTSTNTATFSETVSAGTYWYRVHAVSSNGTSLGSNVVKITVE